MYDVYLCLTTQHDWRLVLVAVAVCVVACTSALFIYSKFEPLLPQIREELNPAFLSNIEAAVKSHPAVEAKLNQIREMRARMAAQAAPAKK